MDIDMIIEKHLMNEGKKPSISFYTGEYERSHGKKPGGRGGWGFDIEPKELAELLKDHKDVSWVQDNTVMIKGSMTLSNAKKVLTKAIMDVYPEDAKEFRVDVEVAT